jgi:molecular chaperone DnaJ
MNMMAAMQVLDLTEPSFTMKELKQQYRMYALMYHPDKNPAPDASARFQEIKDAYDFLCPYCVLERSLDEDSDLGSEEMQENTYSSILKYFMGSLQNAYSDKINDVLHEIVEKMLSVCEKQSIHILESINLPKFGIIYSILTKYRHVFLLSPEFYEEMDKIREKKEGGMEVIELRPKIEDMFQHMVYKLVRKDAIYLVPLWHQEMVFEEIEEDEEEKREEGVKIEEREKNPPKEFMVKCIPDFSSLIDSFSREEDYRSNLGAFRCEKGWIDEDNNVHLRLKISILKLFEISRQKQTVYIKLSKDKTISFSPEKLHIIAEKEQVLRWRKEGISRISLDIQDISQKSDLVIHVLLSL